MIWLCRCWDFPRRTAPDEGWMLKQVQHDGEKALPPSPRSLGFRETVGAEARFKALEPGDEHRAAEGHADQEAVLIVMDVYAAAEAQLAMRHHFVRDDLPRALEGMEFGGMKIGTFPPLPILRQIATFVMVKEILGHGRDATIGPARPKLRIYTGKRDGN